LHSVSPSNNCNAGILPHPGFGKQWKRAGEIAKKPLAVSALSVCALQSSAFATLAHAQNTNLRAKVFSEKHHLYFLTRANKRNDEQKSGLLFLTRGNNATGDGLFITRAKNGGAGSAVSG